MPRKPQGGKVSCLLAIFKKVKSAPMTAVSNPPTGGWTLKSKRKKKEMIKSCNTLAEKR